jgi:two-component system phosphate regulon sensor histidine kinase PhoR
MKLKAHYLYYLIGMIMAGLIGIQVYWIAHSIRLQQVAVERILKEDVEKIAKQVEEEAYCFTFFSKAYIKGGEGVYMVKQKWQDGKFYGPKEGGYLDTLDLFNVFYMDTDTAFYKEHTIWFEKRPATVDVSMKFTFVGLNPNIRRRDTSSYIINNLNAENYKEVLANHFKIDEAIDVDLLDSLLVAALKRSRLEPVYYAGIRKEGAPAFEYLKPGTTAQHLRKGTIKASMLNTRFDRPYELLLYVPDSFNSAIRSMSVMMVSSFIIILILVLSFGYFVRTIMRQRRLSEMKNTFINNITHEFRTPITNINLAVENWKDMPDRGRQYLNIIEEENRHMEKNVEQILQLATMEHSNGYCYALENVNIHDLVDETLAYFLIQLDNVGGHAIKQFNAADPWIRADRNQLKNMLHNLIDNSIKYRCNQRDLVITVSTYNIGSLFTMQLEDNGIGMNAETQKHVFNRFFRGHTGDRHDVKGFGLGLSYVKHIIDAHKGEIHVRSKQNKGTRFTIYLPHNLKHD